MHIIFLIWIGCAFLAAFIAGRRNAAGTGLVLGAIFGPVGVIAAFAADGRQKCPACQERIQNFARSCVHCHVGLSWNRFGLLWIEVAEQGQEPWIERPPVKRKGPPPVPPPIIEDPPPPVGWWKP